MDKLSRYIKRALCEPPIIAYPYFYIRLILETYVSSYTAGVMFSKNGREGKLHPIHFAIRAMNQASEHYSVCEKET